MQAFPEIIYITKKHKFRYEGSRTVESMVAFANRVHRPDTINLVSCKQIKEATEQHEVIIVSNIKSSSSRLRQNYEAVAGKLKAQHRFYQFDGLCDKFIDSEGLYLIKRHLSKAIRFNITDKTHNAQDSQASIESWINLSSFPVYGQLLGSNMNQLLGTNKPLVIAILDFHLPASKFTRSSYEFHKAFERFARKYVQESDEFIFVWTRDLSLIDNVALHSVIVPNLIIIKPDLSYHALLNDQADLPDKPDRTLPDKLKDYNYIEELLSMVSSNSIKFHGGDGYVHQLMRSVYGQYMRFGNVYKREPILATVLVALPTTIFAYILYLLFSDQNQGTIDDSDRSMQAYATVERQNGSSTDDEEDEYNESCSGDASAEVSTRSSELSDDFEPIELPEDDTTYKDPQIDDRIKID